jgi:conjugal transfer/type IV secretion protein DotA/TraY
MIELPTSPTVPDNDLSAQLLDQLLGPGWDTLSPQAGGTEVASLTREVLAAFNYLALFALSLIFVWHVIRALLATAQEGRLGGRVFGGLWLPLRLAGALTLAAPVYNGLSIFQAGLLLAVGFSLNVANHVWAEGLEFFVSHGGRLTHQAPASVVEDAQELGRGILQALTIQEYYRQRLGRPLVGPLATEEFWPPAGTAGGQLTISFNPPPGSALKPGELGRIRIPCPSQASRLCQARLSATRGLMTSLTAIAQRLVDLELPLDQAPADQLGRAVLAYQGAIEPYLAAEATDSQRELSQDLRRFAGAARENGWLMAGACYWTITGLNRRGAQSLYESVSLAEGKTLALEGEVLSDFEAVMARYERYLDGAYSLARSLGARAAPAEFPSLAWLQAKLAGALGRYGLERFTTHLAQGDPITALASLGNFLIGAAETVIGLKVLTMALTAASQNSSTSWLGQVVSALSGSVTSFLTGLAGGTVQALGPYLTALSLLLLGYGFFLAYFLPALPLLFWLAGVLGWILMVVESLVAAPLWLAAHALPEGEGLTSQASRRGYLIFLGVLLRPPLMVLGFLLAMAIINLLGRLTGQAVTLLGEEILKSGFLGISGFLALAGLFGAATVTAAYKLFSLTTQLPARVGGWIGQAGADWGETADVRQNQGSFQTQGALGTAALQRAVPTRMVPGP